MTTEFDAKKAWDELNAEENPALGAALAAVAPPSSAPAVDGEQPRDMERSPEEEALRAAQAAADEELAAQSPQPKDPVSQLTEQISLLQQQLKEQTEASTKQLRDLNGRYGGLQRELQQVRQEATVAKAAAAAQPSMQQAIAEAQQTPEKWAAFKKEWEGSGMTEAIEDFVRSQVPAAGADTSKLLEERLATQRAEYEQQIATMRQELVDVRMTMGRPKWRETIRSDEFNTWRAAQPPEVQALALSPRVEDALEMLRLYDESTAAPAADKSKNRERLEAAVHPTRAEHQPRRTLRIEEMTPQQLWAYEARLEAAREGRAN